MQHGRCGIESGSHAAPQLAARASRGRHSPRRRLERNGRLHMPASGGERGAARRVYVERACIEVLFRRYTNRFRSIRRPEEPVFPVGPPTVSVTAVCVNWFVRGWWSPNEGFREGTLRARALARAARAPHLRSRPANGASYELILSLYLHGFHLLQPCQVLLSRAFSARGQHDKHMLKLCHRESQRTKSHSL